MKKLLVLLLIPLFFLLLTFQTYAQSNIKSGENVSLPRNQTINKDYFTAGEKVTVSGTVNGDAYVAGGNVLVDGTINGDLLVTGGSVTIRGTVTQDVRVAGGELIISGKIGGNMTALGGSINISDSATIGKSLVTAGGNIKIFAPVAKDLTVAGGDVTLGSTLASDVTAAVGILTLSSDANIAGDLNYWSNKEAINQDARIGGRINFHKIEQVNFEKQRRDAGRTATGFAQGLSLLSFLTHLILGLLFIRFLPVFSRNISNTLLDKPGKSILVGLLTMFLFPVIFIALLLTLIGIPVAFIILAILLILLYFLKIFISLATGIVTLRLMNKETSLIWTFILGLVIVTILTHLPVIGPILSFLATLFALGAILLVKKDYYDTLRTKKLI